MGHVHRCSTRHVAAAPRNRHTACSCNCPTEATTPNNFMKLLGSNGSTFDMWCTDKPCYNLTGNQFRVGRNGGPVGDISKYGDFQYTQEAMQIISKHNPTTPLFFYISFQNNHEPLVRASLTKSRFSPMSHPIRTDILMIIVLTTVT